MRYHPEHPSPTIFKDEFQGYFSGVTDQIYDFMEDSNGNFWAASNVGLFHIRLVDADQIAVDKWQKEYSLYPLKTLI